MTTLTPETKLTQGEAARLLGTSPSYVHYLHREGRLPAELTGGGMRLYRVADVSRLRDEREARKRSQAGAV